MKTHFLFLIILVFAIIFSNCDSPSVPEYPKPRLITLDGKVWKWEKYKDLNGSIINVKDSNSHPFFIHFVNDSIIRGISGCNEFQFCYRIVNDSILSRGGFTTHVGCPLTGMFTNGLSCMYKFYANEDELIIKTNIKSPCYPEDENCKVLYFSRNRSQPKFYDSVYKEFDINSDKIIDFSFAYIFHYDSTGPRSQKFVILLPDSNYLGLIYHLQPFKDVIDSKTRFNRRKIVLISQIHRYDFGWYDYWFPSFKNLYWAVKVLLPDGYHYGWFNISVNEFGEYKINDFALSKEPEKPIVIGMK